METNVPYKHIPKAIDLDLYDQLIAEIQPKREYMSVTYYQENIFERRETAWQTSTDLSAEYSGKIMKPVPFTPTVARVKELVEKTVGVEFDSALVFHYINNKDSMGYHYDTVGVSRGTNIAGVTFGGTRRLGIRNNKTNEKEFFELGNGDIFYMFDDCQQRYKHAVLPVDSDKPSEPRLAITFRQIANCQQK